MRTRVVLWFRVATCVAAGSLPVMLCAADPSPPHWVQDSFEDFSAGQFADSGVDLYVTHRGVVKAVNRFDLNGDGFLDLVFNSSHDERRAILPTCIEVAAGGREPRTLPLPTYGTSAAVITDLNRDGQPEAITLPNDSGTTKRRLLSVFWADPDGWSGERRTTLWTMDARALAAADLNADGWPDLAVLNGSRWAPEDGPEAVIRIYWGSTEGFRHEAHQDIVVAAAVDLQTADLDVDGRSELLVLQSEPGRVLVFWQDVVGLAAPETIALGTPAAGRLAVADIDADKRPEFVVSGGIREVLSTDPTTGKSEYRFTGVSIVSPKGAPRHFAPPRSIPAPQSSALCVTDLDGDGRSEILLADRSAVGDGVQILWGDSTGEFKQRPITTLPVAWASALAAGDIDGDGVIDLAIGTARSENTHQSRSPVFFGNGQGGFAPGFTVETAGVDGVAFVRDEQRARLIFCNVLAGRIREDVPVTVYWGDGRSFDQARTSRYSIRSGYASVAADLNDDDYVDLVLLSIVHANAENHPGIGFNILWGGTEGLKDARRTVLTEYGLWGVSVADIDRDGWLDLIGNCNRPSPEGEPMRVVIWRGGPDGFSRARRTVLPADGAEGQNLAADFNRDGFLDIAVAQERAHRVTIFHGARDGFSEKRTTVLPLVAANDLKTADLNRDGWLDLVVTAHKMPDTSFFDFGTYIFWGDPAGFKPTNARQLPGQDGIGVTIADWDADGWLDIFLPGYHYGHTREGVSAHLFWGGPDGFDDLRQSELLQDGGHGAMAADFNGDGRLDLAIACHTRNGNHNTDSLVYWGDGTRFKHLRSLRLPTVGSHFMQRADVGNLYDRTYRQIYTSAVLPWRQPCAEARVQVMARVPGQTRLEFSWRAADTAEVLATRPWTPAAGDTVSLRPDDRCLQYRAAFVSDNGDRYPELDRVEINLR